MANKTRISKLVSVGLSSKMYKSGAANLPLHYGSAPAWLFDQMARLAREITLVIVGEFPTRQVLQRLADPFWFQAFGCVLGFDWQSSGLTTTTCAALKEGLRGLESQIGLFVCGGKGKTSRKTPVEIESWADKIGFNPKNLITASKLAAKVDNSVLQDGYQLYHHSFVFNAEGSWAVVQQGMNQAETDLGWARRYHWFNPTPVRKNFVEEPENAICSDKLGFCLNLTSRKSRGVRQKSVELSQEKPQDLIDEIAVLKRKIGVSPDESNQLCLLESIQGSIDPVGKNNHLNLPARHHVLLSDLNPTKLKQVFLSTYERRPSNYTELVEIFGVGAKTLRALTLLAELIYGEKASYQDPARYSFAHGGKDGHPYPVDRETYQASITFLSDALNKAKLGRGEKIAAFRRLGRFR